MYLEFLLHHYLGLAGESVVHDDAGDLLCVPFKVRSSASCGCSSPPPAGCCKAHANTLMPAQDSIKKWFSRMGTALRICGWTKAYDERDSPVRNPLYGGSSQFGGDNFVLEKFKLGYGQLLDVGGVRPGAAREISQCDALAVLGHMRGVGRRLLQQKDAAGLLALRDSLWCVALAAGRGWCPFTTQKHTQEHRRRSLSRAGRCGASCFSGAA